MNNQQFRRLVLDTPSITSNSSNNGATPRSAGVAASALGSRIRSSIPMTPRSVAGSAGVDFARQLREQHASSTGTKKFRSSAAPKGTKLASGYQDRTQLRTSAEEDAKAARIKALEDMVKLGQMEQATFEALRDEIVGGDVHLVKGLDWKLLERVRKGEDVLAEKPPPEDNPPEIREAREDVNADEALQDLEEKEVKPIAKAERVKKGEMAPPPPGLAGKKRTRDDILRELKESRLKVAEEKKAQQPSLGPKFKKMGAKQETSRLERDQRGREVLITVDEDGNVKRKVKKFKANDEPTNKTHGLLMPDKDVKPLGMEVPELKAPEPPVEEDMDIFEGVGNDYDPLGGTDDDDDDNDGSDSMTEETQRVSTMSDGTHLPRTDEDKVADEPGPLPISAPSEMLPPPLRNKPPAAARNYFDDTSSAQIGESPAQANPLTDPTILAALKRASAIKARSPSPDAATEEEAAKLARRKRLLQGHDRDAEDMDLGFGSSRFDDQEEGEDRQIKLSVWGRDGGGEDGQGEGKGKRKRGGKKRKGDKNSAADVLKVMERRKEEGK